MMTAEESRLLGEINARTKAIEDKLNDHINQSRLHIGNALAFFTGVGGLIAGVAAFIHKGP
jgi:hypothetical protein